MRKDILIDTVNWKFGEQQYADYDSFIKDVTAYNKMMLPDFSWEHTAAVLNTETVTIFYESKESTGDKYLDLVLTGSSNQFTEGELLFQLNNNSFDFFTEKDFRYFEGVYIAEDDEDGIVLGLVLTD